MHYISHHFVADDNQLVLEPADWTEEQFDAFMRIFGLKEAERIVITEYRLEAYGSELTEDDWTKAYDHLNFIMSEYVMIGPSGALGLYGVLVPLKKRYDMGERSVGLYNEIMECE